MQHTAQVVGHYSGTQKTEFLMIHKDIDESEGQGREDICPPKGIVVCFCNISENSVYKQKRGSCHEMEEGFWVQF